MTDDIISMSNKIEELKTIMSEIDYESKSTVIEIDHIQAVMEKNKNIIHKEDYKKMQEMILELDVRHQELRLVYVDLSRDFALLNMSRRDVETTGAHVSPLV